MGIIGGNSAMATVLLLLLLGLLCPNDAYVSVIDCSGTMGRTKITETWDCGGGTSFIDCERHEEDCSGCSATGQGTGGNQYYAADGDFVTATGESWNCYSKCNGYTT